MIQTIDNEHIASAVNNGWPKFRKSDDAKLKIMVQVNTSKEEGMFHLRRSIFCRIKLYYLEGLTDSIFFKIKISNI